MGEMESFFMQYGGDRKYENNMPETWMGGQTREGMNGSETIPSFVYNLDTKYGLKQVYDRDPDVIRFKNLNYKIRGKASPSILALYTEKRRKDEFDENELKDTLKPNKRKNIVKIGNCQCKSVWCPKCHKLYYVKKYKDYIQRFDYTKTRHVILTTDRKKFSDPLEALETITGKKEVSEFLKKLKRGKKVKKGEAWICAYNPVKINRALAVLEFYEDGFPHWHVLIEVDEVGKAGMIGGDNLHRTWKYGVVKETYFRNKAHWKNIAGYFADKGYFEKGKEYQSVLPECIKDNLNRKIRRVTCYKGINERVNRENGEHITEEEAFREVEKYFSEKAKKKENRKKNNEVNYRTILEKCGTRTYVKTIYNRKRIIMIVPIHFEKMKQMIEPEYIEGKGYICNLTFEAIELLASYAEDLWVSHRDVIETDYDLEIEEEFI